MIKIKPFGSIDGIDVPLLVISDGSISVELIPYGAAIRSIIVPDKNGIPTDICLGYDTLEQYQALDACFGGTIGRCANRIGGAGFEIEGKEYNVTANEGANMLHGGNEGFHKKLWQYSCDGSSVTFSLDSPDGDEGFPGYLRVEVCYTLKGSTLFIEYHAVSDKDTVVNLTNHAYFNLSGHDHGKTDDHLLTVNADRYTLADEGNVPTGEISSVEGTVLDLRSAVLLESRLHRPELAASRGFDHNFVLNGGASPAAVLVSQTSGIALELHTSLEGMQLYSSGFLTERVGKNGAIYGKSHALCLEPQHFPDAVNHPNFPSPILKAGDQYRQTISFKFFTI